MLAKILAVVTRPPIPAVVGILIAVAVIWFGGNLLYKGLGWPSQTVTVALCIAVVLLGVAFLVGKRIRGRAKARAIENEIRAQAQTQIATVRPDRQGDIGELQRRFDEALESLKTSKLGRGALYAMPWYVIIGPPGSGKTTAITESGLNFPTFKGPQQKRGIRGLGGTRNCDWWFTDQAILLDTAGRYTTEAEDRDEWFAFLGMIKKARKLKPINGVMVAISVADVLAADEAGLEKHAETIRQRIDELVKQLEVVFPVYLVFTKCDLLDGFVEFFGAMSKEARGQVWGATFDRRPPGEPMHEAFAREFDLLCQQADQERNRLLVADRPARQQKKVFSLPLQLRAARRKLVEFARLLTQPNPYSEASDLRGFYLTSGTQEGAPIDIVLQSMSKAFGLQPQADTTGGEHVEAKSYFIRDLFSKVMFADRELAHSSARVMKRRQVIRMAAIIGSVAALLVLGVDSVLRYSSTGRLVTEAKAAILARASLPISPQRQEPPAKEAMDRLNELRDRYTALRDAYSATSILGPAWETVVHAMIEYARGVQAAFLQPAKDHVERRLREYAAKPPESGKPTEQGVYKSYSQLLLFYRALDRGYFPEDSLGEAIQQQNLWKWSPAELGRFGDSAATSQESLHMQAYVGSRRLHDCWVLGNDKALIGQVEERLRSTGQLDSFVNGVLKDNDTLLKQSEDAIKKAAVESMEKQGGPGRTLTEAEATEVGRMASDQRKQLVLQRVANIGLENSKSLDLIGKSLVDLNKPDSRQMDAMTQALATLRLAGAMPPPGTIGTDPVADTYAKCLEDLTRLREPVENLVSGRSLGQRILPDLLVGKQERLNAFSQKVREVGNEIRRKLEKLSSGAGQALAGPAMVPLQQSIDNMLDSVVEGLARELRAETQELWQKRVGSDLEAALQQFPFRRDAAATADDMPPGRFQELFKPGGKIDDALEALKKVQALTEFGSKLQSGDGFAGFTAKVKAIQAACFDPQAPTAPARLQFHIASMSYGTDVSDLILTIASGTAVSKGGGTPSSIANPLRTWAVGSQGTAVAIVLTLKENNQNVVLTVPEAKDPRANSAWGLLRVLGAAESAVVQDTVRFSWKRTYATSDATEPRTYTAAIALRAEGTPSPFDPGFFALEAPTRVFKADQGP